MNMPRENSFPPRTLNPSGWLSFTRSTTLRRVGEASNRFLPTRSWTGKTGVEEEEDKEDVLP